YLLSARLTPPDGRRLPPQLGQRCFHASHAASLRAPISQLASVLDRAAIRPTSLLIGWIVLNEPSGCIRLKVWRWWSLSLLRLAFRDGWFAVGGRAEWCRQFRPAERWRFFGLAAPLREARHRVWRRVPCWCRESGSVACNGWRLDGQASGSSLTKSG